MKGELFKFGTVDIESALPSGSIQSPCTASCSPTAGTTYDQSQVDKTTRG